MNTQAPALVVLAAGMARRYGGVKPLAPIGPNGEAVLDLLVSDAVAAGFGRIVLVLHPETGPSIRYHVEQTWPERIEVVFGTQRLPLGTVHAVLAARDLLEPDASFAVSNADDVYGMGPMRQLADHLVSDRMEHTLIGFHLGSTISTDDPVTRGICRVGPDGLLTGLDERRLVTRHDGGVSFRPGDGLEPGELPPDALASVNLWGFRPDIWDVLQAAMDHSGLDEEALLAQVAAGQEIPKSEVLLPEVVATMVQAGEGLPVRVQPTDAVLMGVTHAADLPVVSAELAQMVSQGERPARLWGN